MSSKLINRRQFLTLPLAAILGSALGSALAPLAQALAVADIRQAAYVADVDVLYGLLSFRLDGTITEMVDRAAGRYDVRAVGEGDGIANQMESHGALRDGRWQPLRLRAGVWRGGPGGTARPGRGSCRAKGTRTRDPTTSRSSTAPSWCPSGSS